LNTFIASIAITPYELRVGLNFLSVSEAEIKNSQISIRSSHDIKGNMALDFALFIWEE
jgi:hypothetical protein